MTTQTSDERAARLEAIATNHDAMIKTLDMIADRQQDTPEALTGLAKETGQDTQQTHRLWVRLAQRYGWLEDDDLA